MTAVDRSLGHHVVHGIKLPEAIPARNFEQALRYQARADDLFVATFPRSGTTWTQQIIHLLLNDGRPPTDLFDFTRRNPFLDAFGATAVETMPRPGAIKTHLPRDMVPWHDQAGYVYVARNPLDVCVSLYHYLREDPIYGALGNDFEQFVELFLAGETPYGDYFDHVLGWWQQRNRANVLFLTYEQLHDDFAAAVSMLARFLRRGGIAADVTPELLASVERYSDFSHMRRITAEAVELRRAAGARSCPPTGSTAYGLEWTRAGDIEFDKHFRKGVVSRGAELFGDRQASRMRERFRTKTRGTAIAALWPWMTA